MLEVSAPELVDHYNICKRVQKLGMVLPQQQVVRPGLIITKLD